MHFAVPPQSVSILSKREPLSAGKQYWLECRSFGSRPSAVITWWKGDKFMGKMESKVRQNLSRNFPYSIQELRFSKLTEK